MCDLGINAEDFNPRVFYVLKRKFDYESNPSYHSHDYISLIYILSGTCNYNIDGASYAVKKGDLVVCNPGVFHGKTLLPGEEVSEFHVGFNNVTLRNLPPHCIIDHKSCPVISFTKYETDFYKCYNEILLEQEKNEPGCDLILKSLIMKLISIFLKEAHHTEFSGESTPLNFEYYEKTDVVNAIASYINENYMNNMSLDKISRNMYLSPAYVSKIFKEETGDSPINYLIKVRLSKARDILEEGRLSIKAAAERVGYTDVYHFSKLFKKYYGYPPSKHKT